MLRQLKRSIDFLVLEIQCLLKANNRKKKHHSKTNDVLFIILKAELKR